jgi:type IV pilus assembly protein PilY1
MPHTPLRLTSLLQPARQACRLSLIALVLLSQSLVPAWSAPSQTPLINRPGNKPKPNVVLTLDDSGSMTYQYAPERSFVKNGYTVDFPNDGRVYMHPDELIQNTFGFGTSNVRASLRADSTFPTGATNLATLSTIEQIFQVQFRSPDVNSIYYNPSISYQPWQRLGTDGNIVRNAFRQADFTDAHLDPMWMDSLSRSTADTGSVNLSLTSTVNAAWYCGVINGSPSYGTCPASQKSFNPALFYLLNAGANPNVPGNYTVYNLNDGAASYSYPARYSARTDCTLGTNSTVCTAATEKQNFANWFVYYRSRLMIAKGALPDTFNAFSDSLRVGWGTIHAGNYTVDGQASTTVQQGVRNLDTSHKISFTNWLRALSTQAGTPTLGAVASVGGYFKRTDAGSPWRNDMTTLGTSASAVQQSALSCRRAYNVVITDGYYRADAGDRRANISDNVDNTTVTASASSLNNYTPDFPFKDGGSGTLADYAMKFWAEDLQPGNANSGLPGIADEVEPIVVTPTNTSTSSNPSAADVRLAQVKSDPATWQHLTQFFVGFGVTGLFTPDDTTLRGLNNGSATSVDRSVTYWQDTPNQIDDLWHAAINSRGAYFKVNNNEELKQALTTALTLVDRSALKEAGLATASSTLSAGNFKYVPEYHAVSWVGDIKAYTLDASGNVGATPTWSAADRLPAWDSRHIYFWKSSATLSTGPVNLDAGSAMPFRHTNLSTSDQALVSAPLVNYIRGKVEAGSGLRERLETNVDGTTRVNLLPDFVNSTPLFVNGALDLGYATLPGTPNATATANYASFLAGKAARSSGALFIGGNSGMLHAFDATTGEEKFAFLPRTGLSKLASIARADYGSGANYHQYIVDGPLVESDVYAALGTASAAWHNIVVGTMGAGGKAVFALKLNTADPTDLDAGSVLWESTGEQSADMGYITTEPQVGVMPDGSWKVFVGNGVESSSGKAALLVIDVATGAASSIVAATPADANAPRNGLGGVALVKNQLGQVIGAYAGDMQGKLWRFEYDSASSGLVVGYGGGALFRAYDGALGTAAPQPILAAPVVISHPQGGQVVVLNTGRLLYDQVGSNPGDAGSTQTQTVYGIWDHEDIDQLTATKTSQFALAPSDRALLQEQSITAVSSLSTTSATFYDLSSNNVTWGAASGGQGWLLDLRVPDSASTTTTYSYPKAIYPPLKLGRSVLITAVKPGAIVESCSSTQATGYGFFIRALTGARSLRTSIDANGNGTFDAAESGIGGFTYSGGGSQRILSGTPTTGDSTQPSCTPGRAENASGGRNLRACDDPSTNNTRRIKGRVWRQLLTPPQP